MHERPREETDWRVNEGPSVTPGPYKEFEVGWIQACNAAEFWEPPRPRRLSDVIDYKKLDEIYHDRHSSASESEAEEQEVQAASAEDEASMIAGHATRNTADDLPRGTDSGNIEASNEVIDHVDNWQSVAIGQ